MREYDSYSRGRKGRVEEDEHGLLHITDPHLRARRYEEVLEALKENAKLKHQVQALQTALDLALTYLDDPIVLAAVRAEAKSSRR